MNCGRIVHFYDSFFTAINYQSYKRKRYLESRQGLTKSPASLVTSGANHTLPTANNSIYKAKRSLTATWGFNSSIDPKDRQPDREVSRGLKTKF